MDLFEASRVQELEQLIVRYQDSYYNGESEVSDAEFDLLWDELKRLDPANPILHRVGADNGSFAKASHVMPMGSQEKAANPQEFMAWAQKHVYPEYLVEYKLDGASLELQYRDGLLVQAVTRGDGTTGDVITENAKKMHGVMTALYVGAKRDSFTGGVRGEVIMRHQVHDKHFPDKANCRNAANGLMKRKDGNGSEYLDVIAYDVWSTEGKQPYADEEEKLAWLTQRGFTAVPLYIAHSAEEVISYREKVMQERKNLDYDIDGLVIKERTVNHTDALRDRPDRQIAFKFALEQAQSIVRSVEWSQSGATYTPVAVFDPVPLNGTKVKRASLSNPNNIRSLGVKIGSTVTVVKGGEIIPKIIAATHDSSEKCSDIVFPTECATCKTPLVDEGTRLYCPNRQCPERMLHQILKWDSVVDIRGFGDTLVRSLFADGLVRSISDIYSLTEEKLTPYFLTQKSQTQEKKSLGAEKVYKSIQSRRKINLVRFIAGFDIEGIGEALVELLVSEGYDTLEKLFALSEEQVSSVHGFADIMAHTFVQGLKENKEEMLSLVSSGTITIEQVLAKGEGKLNGKSFCFTGELLSMKRSDAQELVKQNGGSVKSSVVKDLSYLVTNDTSSGSSKNAKAASLGIPVISEKEFLELLK